MGSTILLNQNLHFLLAKSYRLAGQPEQALQVVERCREKHPSDFRAPLELAEIYTQQCKHDRAADALREAISLKPELEAGVGTRIAVALGAVSNPQATDRLVDQFCARHPEVWRLIDQLCGAYWLTFRQLSPAAQERWKRAVFLAY